MSTEKTITLDELAAAAFADMTPIERLTWAMQKRTLEATEAQNSILAASHRATTNGVQFAAEERLRVAGEAHAAIAQGRRAWHAQAVVQLELAAIAGAPVVAVGVRLEGDVPGPGEGLAGQHRVRSCTIVDSAAAVAALRKEIFAPHQDAFNELRRAGDELGVLTLTKALEGAGGAGSVGLRAQTWRSISKPILQKCIRKDGTLEGLLERGACALVGAIEHATEAPGLVVDETRART